MSGKGRTKADMLVRIAAAIQWPELDWGERKECWLHSTEEERLSLLVSAVAVLQEIRKPTKAMTRAACAAMSPGKRPTQERIGIRAVHAVRYQAMIDEALGELKEAHALTFLHEAA